MTLRTKTFTVKLTVLADFSSWEGLYLNHRVLSANDVISGYDVIDSEIIAEEDEDSPDET